MTIEVISTLGVLHSLRRASDLGFKVRLSRAVGPDYASELEATALALSTGQPPPTEWLSGFYFNSALVRIAAGSHRALRVMFAPDRGRFKDLSDRAVAEGKITEPEIELLRWVQDDVNGFKHDGNAALLDSRKIETLDQATNATGQLLGLIRKVVAPVVAVIALFV